MGNILHMKKHNQVRKWVTIKILSSTKNEIQQLCDNKKSGFVNPPQFISFALRKELDRRRK